MTSHYLGDEVLAPWGTDGFLYPAVVVEAHADKVHVAYLDGDEADVPHSSLRQGALGPGLRVNVNFKGQRKYFSGLIKKRINQAVFVVYEDGDQGWATMAQCRILASELAGMHPATMACTYCGSAMDLSAAACPTCGAPRRLHS